jgi:hypothetical protein
MQQRSTADLQFVWWDWTKGDDDRVTSIAGYQRSVQHVIKGHVKFLNENVCDSYTAAAYHGRSSPTGPIINLSDGLDEGAGNRSIFNFNTEHRRSGQYNYKSMRNYNETVIPYSHINPRMSHLEDPAVLATTHGIGLYSPLLPQFFSHNQPCQDKGRLHFGVCAKNNP